MAKKILNIALMAHADAGKTTITENFLYLGGLSKNLGSVDEGTTHSDFLQVERDRGISVRSSFNSFEWKDCCINLIDTPGHIDFTAELERILPVIDAAILVISAVEGIQAQTEAIWDALKERDVPVLLFVNKVDRVGADHEQVLEDIRKEFSSSIYCPQAIESEGEVAVSIQNREGYTEEETELIAGTDEALMEQFFEEEGLAISVLEKGLEKAIAERQLFPVLYGASKLSLGIEALLDFCCERMPKAISRAEEDFSAYVYAIGADKSLGKVAYVRVFSGQLKNRDQVRNIRLDAEEKVSMIKKGFGTRFEAVNSIDSGDIAMVAGLKNVQVGDVLGVESPWIPERVQIHSPLLSIQVSPAADKDYAALASALTVLSEEDPSLAFEWDKEERSLHLKIFGEIQIQVLEAILLNRFGLECQFSDPAVVYKETINAPVEAYERYWMPKPCWAIVTLLIEPGERGSGVSYSSTLSVDKVHQKYQNEVERTIPEALEQSVKGWELTDVKITLVEGEDHVMHSRPGDFVIATNMAIMNGLSEAGTQLLEPVISLKIQAVSEFLGVLSSEIIQRRGQFDSPELDGDKMTMHARMPLSESLDFPVRLSSLTGGKGKLSTRFYGYQECTDEQGVIRPYKGVNPLDRSKYILKMRKALQ